jgi:hypothetical protein
MWIANVDHFRGLAKSGEIPAGIDQARGLVVRAKAIDRAIDGKAFGYPSQIDFHARVMEANAVSRKQLDGIACRRLGKATFGRTVARQQAKFLQRERHRDIEHALRTPMQDK